jgi:SAM-dependent methyltransferase
MSSSSDRVNRGTWESAEALREVRSWKGYIDPGEKAAFDAIAAEARGQPILDLGVGAGRTVPMFRALSEHYVALDYLPAMVDLCARAHPDVKVVQGDARDLSAYADGSFQVVAFSYNGIDAVGHDDRQKILAEVWRVLRPGGTFFFSTFNQEGPSFDEKPWKPRIDFQWNPLRVGQSALRWMGGLPRDLINWTRRRHLNQRGPDWSLMIGVAHHYGLLIHFTTLKQALRELAEARFADGVQVFECRKGARVGPADDVSQAWWFHLLARKPAPKA